MQISVERGLECYGIILPIKQPNHKALGKGTKRTSEEVFFKSGSCPISTIKELRDSGQAPWPESLYACKMGRLGCRISKSLFFQDSHIRALKRWGCVCSTPLQKAWLWQNERLYPSKEERFFRALAIWFFLKNKADFSLSTFFSQPNKYVL